jgi:hypothetical protein
MKSRLNKCIFRSLRNMRRENGIFAIIFLNVQILVLAIKFKVALQSRTSVFGCTKKNSITRNKNEDKY